MSHFLFQYKRCMDMVALDLLKELGYLKKYIIALLIKIM